ncbi:type III secretion protein HrpB4 [Bordetella muralis]|uniref:type III secretion protein HrpB4 n=1 Tax=Bordetella muralis TaxID=1649130 RepID=UPI0039EFE917
MDGMRDPLRALLQAIRHKSAHLVEHMDSSWLERARLELGLEMARLETTMLSRMLRQVYRLNWPDPGAFSVLAHRIVLLPKAEIHRMLAVAALWTQRDRVRLCIANPQRGALVERIGQSAYARLLACPSLPQAHRGPLSLDEIRSQGLILLGARHWVDNITGWHSQDLLDWLSLAIPPADAPDTHIQVHEGIRLMLDDIPALFPEHEWLFGDSMTRSLSISAMASCPQTISRG